MVQADIKFEWEGPPIDETGDQMLQAYDSALDDFIDLTADEATQNLDTGEFQGDGFLKKSQDVIKKPFKKVISYVVRSLTGFNYAIGVEFGTGIYSDFPGASRQPIRPKNAKALRWVDKRTKKVIFVKEVKGMKPRPFLRSAFEVALNRWPELVRKRLERIKKIR